jgi:hypothetical protein
MVGISYNVWLRDLCAVLLWFRHTGHVTTRYMINKDMLVKKHYKEFGKFTNQIDKIKEMNT